MAKTTKKTTTTTTAARKADPAAAPAPERNLGMPHANGPVEVRAYIKAALRAVGPEFDATFILGVYRSGDDFQFALSTKNPIEGALSEQFHAMIPALADAITKGLVASPPAEPKATPKARKRKGA